MKRNRENSIDEESDDHSISKRTPTTKSKPCVCKYEGCGKIISSISNLSRHYLVHTGIKPYECKYCQRKFNQRANLTKHEKAHETTNESVNKESDEDSNSLLDADKEDIGLDMIDSNVFEEKLKEQQEDLPDDDFSQAVEYFYICEDLYSDDQWTHMANLNILTSFTKSVSNFYNTVTAARPNYRTPNMTFGQK